MEKNCDVIENFNAEASESFNNKYLNSAYLDSMDSRDKCVLEKTIAKHLDHANNWETSVIDSFYIRSYNFSDFIDRFSFVTKGNRDFYFIYVPDFNSRFTRTDKFYSKNKTGKLELKEFSDNYIFKFDITLLIDFLNREVTHSNKFPDQVTQVERLLPVLMPHILSKRCYLFDLMDSLAERPLEQRNQIMKRLELVVPAKDLTLGLSSTNRLVYRNGFGFVVVHFKQHKSLEKLELDFYFIPDRYIGRYVRHGEPLFRECYQ